MLKKQHKKRRPTASARSLSRRERQIMDVVYSRGRATVAQVREDLPDPPSYSAVRATLAILESKGHLAHESEGNRYVYLPRVTRKQAARQALDHLVATFFDDSRAQLVAALLETDSGLNDDDLERLAETIEKARKRGTSS